MLASYAFGALIGFEASFTRRSPWFTTVFVAHLHTFSECARDVVQNTILRLSISGPLTSARHSFVVTSGLVLVGLRSASTAHAARTSCFGDIGSVEKIQIPVRWSEQVRTEALYFDADALHWLVRASRMPFKIRKC